jgi:ASC-1-like (ASCH) protein
MRGTKGEFKGWTRDRKFAFTQQAAALATKNLGFGFAIILPDAAYREHYVSGLRPGEVPLDSPYGLCFRYCLSLIPGFAKDAFGDRELSINFVLESGYKNAGDAERIFYLVKKTRSLNPKEQKIARMLNLISFGDKVKFPGLQVADVNAYSSFQHETRGRPIELVKLNPETSMRDAKRIEKVPIFRLELRETELKMFKQFILDEIEEKNARRKKG